MNTKRSGFFATIAIVFFFTSGFAAASDAVLRWQANAETDLQGYNVYHGTQSRSYGPPIPVGATTEYVFSDLEAGQTYFLR